MVTRSGPRPNNSGELLSEKTIVEQDGPFSWPILFSVKAFITEAQRSRKRASLVIFFQSDPIFSFSFVALSTGCFIFSSLFELICHFIQWNTCHNLHGGILWITCCHGCACSSPPNLGRIGLISLVKHFETPQNALEAARTGWPKLPGLRQGLADLVPDSTSDTVQQACQGLNKMNGWVITLWDTGSP